MACPNCGAQDPGPGLFCMTCGKRLPTAAVTPPPAPAETLKAMPVTPAWQSAPPAPTAQPSGSNDSTFNVWGPFAGYGTRGRHVAWLINDHGDQADALRDVVRARFERREIPDATVERVTLTRRGIMVDSRPYFLLRRKLATAGLYITRFGQDLYVSQVTYFKGPFSNARILVVALLLLIFFITPIFASGTLGSLASSFSLFGRSSSPDFGGMLGFFCCLGPLYPIALIAVPLLLMYSVFKWISDKDFLAALRTSPNEFDTDDIVALEKSVEQTVRESLDVVGIEQQLMPPADEYGFRRRLI
jgi:hypothetical protein